MPPFGEVVCCAIYKHCNLGTAVLCLHSVGAVATLLPVKSRHKDERWPGHRTPVRARRAGSRFQLQSCNATGPSLPSFPSVPTTESGLIRPKCFFKSSQMSDSLHRYMGESERSEKE